MAHVARFVEPPGGAGRIAGLPLRKQVALGRSWLFLQPNNSQCGNCQIRNTRTSTASVIPTLGIPAKRRGGPSKADVVPLFPLFYLVEIRHRQLLQSQSRTRSRVLMATRIQCEYGNCMIVLPYSPAA